MSDNKNSIAYGILKQAGVNTSGMSPREAWEIVKRLRLLDRAKGHGYTDEELDAAFAEINGEKPSAEMQRLIKQAKASGIAREVSVTTNNAKSFKKVLETLYRLKKIYGFETLDEIRTADFAGTARVRSDGKVLMLSNRFLEAPDIVIESDISKLAKAEADFKTAKSKFRALLTSQCEDSELLKKAQAEYLEMARKNLFGRRHVGFTENITDEKIIELVMTHEVGHVILDKLPMNKKSIIGKEFNRLKNQYDLLDVPDQIVTIHNVSSRAIDNKNEFFAELFVMYNYENDSMQPELKRIVKEALRK